MKVLDIPVVVPYSVLFKLVRRPTIINFPIDKIEYMYCSVTCRTIDVGYNHSFFWITSRRNLTYTFNISLIMMTDPIQVFGWYLCRPMLGPIRERGVRHANV